jgi:hypothetical protein
LIGLDPDEQDAIADEVAEWGRLVRAFAESHVIEVADDRGGRLAA